MNNTLILTIFFTALFLILALKIVRAIKRNESDNRQYDEVDIDSLNISNLDEKLKAVIKHNGKLEAIKLYREFTNSDLNKAKLYIDDLYKSM